VLIFCQHALQEAFAYFSVVLSRRARNFSRRNVGA